MTSASDRLGKAKFYNLSLQERLALIAEKSGLSPDELAALSGAAGLTADQADHMIENVVGTHNLPLGIAQHFVVNGREVLVPMVIEEPSVVAGASFMAPLAKNAGGFTAHTTPPEMIGQMQIVGLADAASARGSLRLSLGHSSVDADVDALLRVLPGAVDRARRATLAAAGAS